MVAFEAHVFQGQCYFQRFSQFLFICFLFYFVVTVSLDIIHISKVDPFNVYSVVIFSIFTELYIDHHYLILEHVINPPKKAGAHY